MKNRQVTLEKKIAQNKDDLEKVGKTLNFGVSDMNVIVQWYVKQLISFKYFIFPSNLLFFFFFSFQFLVCGFTIQLEGPEIPNKADFEFFLLKSIISLDLVKSKGYKICGI